jgi:hypothetical protein
MIFDVRDLESLSGEEWTMKLDPFAKLLLLVIAVSLSAIAWRSYLTPAVVQAQSGGTFLYIEPGVTMLRAPDGSQQVAGKVVVDMRNGNVWGFPTLSDAPYPVSGATNVPPTSRPFLLGKFAFADVNR